MERISGKWIINSQIGLYIFKMDHNHSTPFKYTLQPTANASPLPKNTTFPATTKQKTALRLFQVSIRHRFTGFSLIAVLFIDWVNDRSPFD
jgi:hypothetical protein